MAMRYMMTPWKWSRRGVPVEREFQGHPMSVFQKEMNQVFDGFFKGFGMRPSGEEIETFEAFSPRVDMTEDEKSVQITAELPGMDDNDIEINLTRDVLTIKGEKKEKKEKKDKEAYYMERSFGSFTRVLPVPAGLDTDKVEATFKKGILNITMPKLEVEKKQQKNLKQK